MANYLRVGGGAGGDRVRVKIEIVQITPAIVAARQVTLPFSPANTAILLLNNFAKQRLGIDYEISGNVISWNGKGLDGFLEPGESFYIYY